MEIKPQEFESKKKRKKKTEDELPLYYLNSGKKKSLKKIIIPLLIVGLIALIIYVPPMVFEEKTTAEYDSVRLSGNPASLQELSIYKSNNLQADFDEDGLINDVEANQSNTGIYTIDHDGDGVTDYAELYINNPPTNPTLYDDGIIEFVKKQDAMNGTQCNTPFTDAGIVMWADDYSSKARGTVIEAYQDVYLFQKFNGYVQFPSNIKSAYQIVGGYQIKLEQNDQGYYHIMSQYSPVYVRVHNKDVEPCGCLSLLGSSYKIKNTGLAKVLSTILPSKGFGLITCKEVLAEDFDESTKESAYQNDYKYINTEMLELSDSRFARNYTKLSDFADIKTHLENGDVAIISLISSNFGESIVEVKGYTNRNNLILCDPVTGTEYGILQIHIQSSRLLDQSGMITRYEFFSFNGCGYSSDNRDRIAILAYIKPDGEITYVNAGETESADPGPIEEPKPDDTETEKPTPNKPGNDPIADAALENTLKAIVYVNIDGSEEKALFKSDDGKKIHRLLGNITLEQYVAHRNTVIQKYGFDYYYSTEGSSESVYCTTICDSQGNILFLKFRPQKAEMLIRFESYDVVHDYVDEGTGYQIQLKPEYFLKELDPK